MFVLRSLGRLILGDPEQRELLELTNLHLYTVKKDKRKSYADSVTLCLIRQDDGYALEVSGFPLVFPVDLSLGLTVQTVNDSSVILWSDTKRGHQWEAICQHPDTPKATMEMFCLTLAQCLFERVEGKPLEEATDADMAHWMQQIKKGVGESAQSLEAKGLEEGSAGKESVVEKESKAGKESQIMLGRIEHECDKVSFYQYDPATNLFQPIAEQVRACLHYQNGYHLAVLQHSTLVHQQVIDPDATFHCDRPTSSFIWCWLNGEQQMITLSLRFTSPLDLLAWSNALGRIIYECLNELSMEKLSLEDATYLMAPFIASEAEESDEESSSEESASEESDEYGSEEDEAVSAREGKQNQQLVVGYKHDRSFVTRGAEIDIFKHPDDQDRMKQVASLTVDWRGREFTPSKLLLHDQDSSLLLLDGEHEDTVYRMDLERGAVVEEWRVKEGMAISQMIPDQKYAQLTSNPCLVGLNANSIFKLDSRLAGDKLVDSQSKQYAVKHDFTAAATTGQGELAVASAKGEIRLFNKLGIRAKSLLPGFGDPILAIDVSESGHLVLATCKTYLLLIETHASGESAFTKSLSNQLSPPKRLQLKPEHVAHMGCPPSFTPARFNYSNEERFIITSTGPYVITWNLRRVKQGHLYDYQMRRYEERVVADGFRFGQDRSIVVTLPHQVTMISKKSLSSPARELTKKPRK